MSNYVIEVDQYPEYSEDSAYMSEYDTDTSSLASHMKNHVFENGRRFHGWHQGRYAMPNDEEEQDRMDLQHHICLLIRKGRLYSAPHIKDLERILDVGTGNGIWAIDCGDQYPNAQVIGVDLSPIQPRWVPPNVTFEVDDVEQTWTHQSNSFDLIHIRQLGGFIDDWRRMYEQALRVLKPGGIIEIDDFIEIQCDDGTVPEDAAMMKWSRSWVEAIEKSGRTLPMKEHAQELAKVGFEQIKYEHVKVAVGTWPKNKAEKDMGYYMRQHMIDGCESIALGVLTRFLGWRKDDVDILNESLRSELRNKNYHSYVNYHTTYGKKPMECSSGSVAV